MSKSYLMFDNLRYMMLYNLYYSMTFFENIDNDVYIFSAKSISKRILLKGYENSLKNQETVIFINKKFNNRQERREKC